MTVPFRAVAAPEAPAPALDLVVSASPSSRAPIYVTAGARVALGGTVTERSGRDISGYQARTAVTFAGRPPSPDQFTDTPATSGGSPAQLNVTRVVTDSDPLGPVQVWISLTGPAGVTVVPAGIWTLA